MTNRFLLKQFAGNAQNSGVFGSFQAGVKELSSDPEEIQKLDAWENGWCDAVSSGSRTPKLEEMQGVQYVLCRALKELYSEGVPQWKSGETYYQYSIVSFTSGDVLRLFYNKTGEYSDTDPAVDTVNWELLDKVFTSKADLDSPDFCGIPTAPTAPAGTDTQQIATTSFVKTAISATPCIALSQTSGTITLETNNVYQLAVSGATTFVLPAPSGLNKSTVNQIVLMLSSGSACAVNWGTDVFRRGVTPNIGAGIYWVFFDFDNNLDKWICGSM